jgi:beta-1,4-N-acetylglucosaminyltransferase
VRRRSRTELLLVCQPGGHLVELVALRRVWCFFRRCWVTLDSPDARSLLRDEEVVFAHGPTVRSIPNLLRNLALALRLLARERPAVILTTGAALAVPFVWVGRLFRARVVYIECGGRVDRPSLACRLIAPLADRVYVQWPELVRAIPRARHVGRIRLAQNALEARSSDHPRAAGAIFVTVGTCPFPFDRLMRALEPLSSSDDVVVQVGHSTVRPAGADCVDFLPFEEFVACLRGARAVVTHAGIGSVLVTQSVGRRPIVVPRLSELGENVDDHQVAFARRLSASGEVTLVEDVERLPTVLAGTDDSGRPPTGETNALADELLAYVRAIR